MTTITLTLEMQLFLAELPLSPDRLYIDSGGGLMLTWTGEADSFSISFHQSKVGAEYSWHRGGDHGFGSLSQTGDKMRRKLLDELRSFLGQTAPTKR